ALLALGTIALLLPANAFARGEFDPTKEFEQHEWIPIHLGPLNLSITKAVVYLMLDGLHDRVRAVLHAVEGGPQGRPARDGGRARLRACADPDRRAGAAAQGDRALVPVRGDAAALHLRREPARLHPATADRRDLARRSDLGDLRGDQLALGDA